MVGVLKVGLWFDKFVAADVDEIPATPPIKRRKTIEERSRVFMGSSSCY
jgi:hypothetical protein